MECSWIMIWIPSKQRERTIKKNSKTGGSRKLSHLFSQDKSLPSNIDNTENKTIDIQSEVDKVPLEPESFPQKDNCNFSPFGICSHLSPISSSSGHFANLNSKHVPEKQESSV